MMHYYRLGWPLGSVVAKLGVPTMIRVDVIRDAEANVFVGTSQDLRGLVVESDTLEGLAKEAEALIPELMQKPRVDAIASVRYNSRLCRA